MNAAHSLLLIGIMSGVTILLRAAPFVLFTRNTPKAIEYLGQVLPYSIMAMLVVYCLKGLSLFGATHGIPEIAAVAVTVAVHKWKHNTLLSILVGTVCYMIFIQGMT